MMARGCLLVFACKRFNSMAAAHLLFEHQQYGNCTKLCILHCNSVVDELMTVHHSDDYSTVRRTFHINVEETTTSLAT